MQNVQVESSSIESLEDSLACFELINFIREIYYGGCDQRCKQSSRLLRHQDW